jgi:HPt (histidine-containing phosphotransfer) domain-containing protein
MTTLKTRRAPAPQPQSGHQSSYIERMSPGLRAGDGEPASVQDGEILDDEVVGGLLALGPGLLGDVVALWAEQLPLALSQIDAQRSGRDAPGLAAAAHGLRGSSANVGARRLARACADLEENARAGTAPELLQDQIRTIAAEAETAREALQETVRNMPAEDGG